LAVSIAPIRPGATSKVPDWVSVATWIANVHQASLSVDSKENAGSVFKIVFPLLAADQCQPDAFPAAGSLASVS
jgi:hypothetical protein